MRSGTAITKSAIAAKSAKRERKRAAAASESVLAMTAAVRSPGPNAASVKTSAMPAAARIAQAMEAGARRWPSTACVCGRGTPSRLNEAAPLLAKRSRLRSAPAASSASAASAVARPVSRAGRSRTLWTSSRARTSASADRSAAAAAGTSESLEGWSASSAETCRAAWRPMR